MLKPKMLKALKRMNNTGPSIYIVKCQDYFKIGYTEDFIARLVNLQCGNPYKLTVLYHQKHPFAKFTEKTIHSTMHGSERRVRGEWYHLGKDDDIQYIIDTIEGCFNIYDRGINGK